MMSLYAKPGTPMLDRLAMRYVVAPSGCWQWTGAVDRQGYSAYGSFDKKPYRLVYEEIVGPVPDGLQLDHLCRNRLCVNPAHLEPVTGAENMRRAAAARTHCKHGHPYEKYARAVRGTRVCRRCDNLRRRKPA